MKKQPASLESQIESIIEFKPYDKATEEVIKIIQQLVEEVIGEDYHGPEGMGAFQKVHDEGYNKRGEKARERAKKLLGDLK